jgi:hypothetical protein
MDVEQNKKNAARHTDVARKIQSEEAHKGNFPTLYG